MTVLDVVIRVDHYMKDNLYILTRPNIIVASRKTTNPQDSYAVCVLWGHTTKALNSGLRYMNTGE